MSKKADLLKMLNKVLDSEDIIDYKDDVPTIDVISTGSPLIDEATGVGGLPRGRIIEVFGGESSGKSTLMIQACVQAQKQGLLVYYVDTEHALDLTYAQALGLDLGELWIHSQPMEAEQAFESIEKVIETGQAGLVVLDSLASMPTAKEAETEMGTAHMGLNARLNSQAMRKLVGKTKKTNTCLAIINQTREKIGVMYGDNTTTPGGNALKFYSTIRIKMTRAKQHKDGLGGDVKAKIIKNKVAPPNKVVETKVLFGKGFDRYFELINLAVDRGVFEGKGWMTCPEFDPEFKIQGREKLYNEAMQNLPLLNYIEEKLGQPLTESLEDI